MNFEKFLKALIEDIVETSRKYATVNFPKDPDIESEIWQISSVLFDGFKKCFLESSETYFIKDLKFRRKYYEKGHLSTKAKEHIAAVNSVNINKNFTKPSKFEVEQGQKHKFKDKQGILDYLAIREVKTGKDLHSSKCTCATYHFKGICHHLLACLLHENKISKPASLPRGVSQGRPRQVPDALERDTPNSNEPKKNKKRKQSQKSKKKK